MIKGVLKLFINSAYFKGLEVEKLSMQLINTNLKTKLFKNK